MGVPWSWLTRILLATLARRLVRSRRGGRPAVDVETIRSRMASAREPAAIAGRFAVVVAVACWCALLIAAGTTMLVLGPRWLGAVLAGVAAASALAAVPELVRLRRALRDRRLRLRAQQVSRELGGGPPTSSSAGSRRV